ncbi:unnamed protein product [Didymodactylos carnosus]|uniref:Uncharacterized protein n=1 Tax=Didymodactylos carnosus TaxID=1234261 RepID=A0A813TSJ7_9BILA|nr:unnamed protein product [Didymodactylos carnosus]CAF0817544.1 unnamed protein product [Didymodactylos carnosus]CAF3500290.1 unnamed protein product [Didymodactylos carnosus]CAF3603780.1 unnamed protein product [Didymodactylos carnosus]
MSADNILNRLTQEDENKQNLNIKSNDNNNARNMTSENDILVKLPSLQEKVSLKYFQQNAQLKYRLNQQLKTFGGDLAKLSLSINDINEEIRKLKDNYTQIDPDFTSLTTNDFTNDEVNTKNEIKTLLTDVNKNIE